ncbi:MAG TPA: MarR family transcriptional regulator [Candidatus Dormibacteraeota bacterium]|nr:MarR family transcriptional regulator [Candidatus Dormibacteraeota bacterium]
MDEIDRIVEQWNRERPDLDVSPTHTIQRITRLSLLHGVSAARVFAAYGISFGEYLVLAALRRAGPPYRMNPTRLFNSVILSSGAMTNRLDRLEEAGLVERQPDPDDRRGRLVALTDKGRELVDAAAVEHLANEQRLLSALDEAEREQLAGLLRKLLLSSPFQELDPAAGPWGAAPAGARADETNGRSRSRSRRTRVPRAGRQAR